jgi:xanthine/uracil permease
MLIVSLSLGIGMIPVVAPTLYDSFPTTVKIIAGGAITSSVIVAFVLNLLFNGGKAEVTTDDPEHAVPASDTATPPAPVKEEA